METETTTLIEHTPHSSSKLQQILNVFMFAGIASSLVLSIAVATGGLPAKNMNTGDINNYYTVNNKFAYGTAPYTLVNVTSVSTLPILVYTHSTSIVGSDGLPVVFVASDLGIEVWKCNDYLCQNATKNFVKTNHFPTIYDPIVGADGLIVMAVFDISFNPVTMSQVLVIHCENLQCANVTVNVLDSQSFVGWSTAIHIASDGYPLLTYMDNNDMTIIVSKCVDYACSKPALRNNVTSFDENVYSLSSAITLDGNLVLFITSVNGNLVTAHCLDLLCTQMEPYNTLGTPGNYTAAIYQDFSGSLHFVVPGSVYTCLNLGCSNVSVVPIAFTDPSDRSYSVATDITGMPIITALSSNFTIVSCGTPDCSVSTTRSNANPIPSQTIYYTSTTVGASGFPLLTLGSLSTVNQNIDVLVITCSNHLCTPWKN